MNQQPKRSNQMLREMYNSLKTHLNAKDFQKAYEIATAILNENDPFWTKQVNRYLPWILFNLKLKSQRISLEELHQTVETIVTLSERKNGFVLRSVSILASETLKKADRKKGLQILQSANELLDKINVDELSDKPLESSKYKDKAGKNKVLPSEREKWYQLKTKILLVLKKYDECIQQCRNALKVSNLIDPVWFYYRIACASSYIGKYEEGLEALEKVLLYKDDWYVQKLFFEIYAKMKDFDNALKYGCRTALNSASDSQKLTFYLNFADFLKAHNYKREADLHYYLYLKTLEKMKDGQKNDTNVKRVYGSLTDKNVVKMREQDVRSELAKFWKDNKFRNEKQLEGTVAKVINNGAGFIKSSDSQSYYFKLEDVENAPKSAHELRNKKVKFYPTKSYDKKKGMESWAAVGIVVVE
ncbi:tetratricopeptide repeat protein [Pseudothermotoga thermarum]|uniref:Tetratricopeptide repeat protein n=1 Tax=Pseudothermotoga thermarum DSM 5069 TaxID=688269 RepID=F7YTP1_9THEM|nr:hypothetical protein [Pseudothermotoga thermarum]AEH51263.1 hypothetical protein Theth_1191 [Pseudothermotoga thermarum DSM 5069]